MKWEIHVTHKRNKDNITGRDQESFRWENIEMNLKEKAVKM
jgi:hypothetical protein